MALSSRVKNKIVDEINVAFKATLDVKMPRNTSNKAPYAWAYWLAWHVAAMANKRKETAEAEAVKAGVLIDKVNDPRPETTRETIYNDDVSIMLEVRRSSPKVNIDRFVDELVKAKVPRRIIDAARQEATTYTRAAHVFTPTLVTENTSGK